MAIEQPNILYKTNSSLYAEDVLDKNITAHQSIIAACESMIYAHESIDNVVISAQHIDVSEKFNMLDVPALLTRSEQQLKMLYEVIADSRKRIDDIRAKCNHDNEQVKDTGPLACFRCNICGHFSWHPTELE